MMQSVFSDGSRWNQPALGMIHGCTGFRSFPTDF
jgi:hypothetical protein